MKPTVTIEEIEERGQDIDKLDDAAFAQLSDDIRACFQAHEAEKSADDTRAIVRLGEVAHKLTSAGEGRRIAAARVSRLPQLVASGASTGGVQRLAGRTVTVPSPESSPTGTATGLVASGSLPGIMPGTPLGDRWDLARAMSDKLRSMDRRGVPHGDVVLASARWTYPESRRLDEDSMRTAELIEQACGLQALIATGGTCAPVNVDYSIGTWAVAERPLRDGLPPFEATRGGIRFVKPPDIEEWESATGVWPEATDAAPGGETKPVKTLTCGTEESVLLQAVSTRMGFGNMQARFAPEQVAANTELAIAAASRVAEESLLNLIEAFCVKKLETAQHLGYGRDLMSAVSYALAAYRNIHRVAEAQTFVAIFPSWVKELLRTDLAREQAHDNAGTFNVWEVSDAQIDDWFKARHINVIWHLDGQKEPSSKNYKTQYWGTPAEGKKLDELLPTEVLPWYFFPEGAVQYLDGGRLDLGVVRDSTLDATNDYETFVEVFESVANRSMTKGVWQILSSLKATGGSAATVTAVAP